AVDRPRWRAPRDDHRRYGLQEPAPEYEVITGRTDVRTRIPLVVPRGTTPASARQLRLIATQNSTSISCSAIVDSSRLRTSSGKDRGRTLVCLRPIVG